MFPNLCLKGAQRNGRSRVRENTEISRESTTMTRKKRIRYQELGKKWIPSGFCALPKRQRVFPSS